MAKIDPDKYASGLYGRTEQYADKVRKFYTNAVNELLLLASSADIKPDEMFRFANNPKMSAKATAILRTLYSNVYATTKGGVKSEWGYANLSCDELVTDIFGKGVVKDNHYARWFSRNQEAMDAFFARKKEGLNLSQRVWNHTGLLKEEMEMALTVSMGAGESAATVSRKVREYLNDPDKLFRRVRDKDGNLQLSKAAKAYRPGRGIYRSSYKNAMRLTRTETNMAYRTADYERWQQFDFVLGVKIQLSGRHPASDICDTLAGKYPKDFKFTGWHPQCFCFATPILATPDEMVAMQKQVLNGDTHTIQCKGVVSEPPKNFKSWISENKDRLSNAENLPYFLRDNSIYLKGIEISQRATTQIRDSIKDFTSVKEIKVISKPRNNFSIYKEYSNGGTIQLMNNIERGNDFKDLLSIARNFATDGCSAQITSKIHFKDDKYKDIFGGLIGTEYYRKCPDLIINGKYYEYESFIRPWTKKKVSSMLSHGSKQSSKIIIDNNKGCSDRYIRKMIIARQNTKVAIDEVWIYEKGGIRAFLKGGKFL